jgi:hypothetical protein
MPFICFHGRLVRVGVRIVTGQEGVLVGGRIQK